MTARVRLVLFAAVALVLAGAVLFFLGRMVLSNDALLLDLVAERRPESVELSLWAGADPNYRDEEGRSALPVAVEHGDLDIVPLLLDAGADPDARTSDGEPVAALAAGRGESGMLAILLEAGADPNARGESGIAILASGVIQGDAVIVRMLLEAGADPNTLVEDDLSVLALAVDRRNTEVVRLLLEAGADPNGPGIAELVRRAGNAGLLQRREAGPITAESLLALASRASNATRSSYSLTDFIEDVFCFLGYNC